MFWLDVIGPAKTKYFLAYGDIMTKILVSTLLATIPLMFSYQAEAGCASPAQNYTIISGHTTPKDGYDIRVLKGSARNCLGGGDNQPGIRLMLKDASVDGFRFCTNAVNFLSPVRMFASDSAWDAANKGAGVMGVIIYGGLDNEGATITMRNRAGGDNMWDMITTTGYYKIPHSGHEGEAYSECVKITRSSLYQQ
jgi:hypothetical protein